MYVIILYGSMNWFLNNLFHKNRLVFEFKYKTTQGISETVKCLFLFQKKYLKYHIIQVHFEYFFIVSNLT